MKTSMRKTVLVALVLTTVSLPLAAATRRRATTPPLFPACDSVAGSPAVTFSRDGGQTFAPVQQKLEGVGYTYGVAALDATTLLSWHKSTLSTSRDSGCSWTAIGEFPDGGFPPAIVAGGANDAWIFSDNREFLAHFDLATRALTTLKAPGSIIGLTVAPAMAQHLRVGTSEANVFDSTDGGATWNRVGIIPVTPFAVYRVAVDPHDFDHIVAGTMGQGVYMTHDGGRNWSQATAPGDGLVNAYQVLVSPADSSVVWAEAMDKAGARHIYRSADGGLTFAAAVDASADVTLINGSVMAVHPTDPNVVYFIFGTYFQGYGTDVFRYDAATRQLRKSHLDVDDIDAIAFSPADPNVMYFGLEVERGVQ
jgi:hypothetical protein